MSTNNQSARRCAAAFHATRQSRESTLFFTNMLATQHWLAATFHSDSTSICLQMVLRLVMPTLLCNIFFVAHVTALPAFTVWAHTAVWSPRLEQVALEPIHPGAMQRLATSIHSLICLLIHSLTHSPPHSLTHSLTHSLIHPPTHPLTHSRTHSFIHSLTQHGSFSRGQVCAALSSAV